MNKFTSLLIPVVIILALSACTKKTTPTSNRTSQPTQGQSRTQEESKTFQFSDPKKSAHWESNTPAHGQTLAGVPINVVIDFNFDLAKPSKISIKNNDQEYAAGETTIDSNKLALRRNVSPMAPDGLYTIAYNACWPDGSCHDGNFQFAINRQSSQSFVDMTNQKKVNISLKNISFLPQSIRISKGTQVTWTNSDSVIHYVNTDSHPAHTYVQNQNSKALSSGDSYSYTFNEAGIYLYHCSAHADTMTGNILVE